MPFSKILFAASIAAVHSFAAADSIITPAPTPTQAQALEPRQGGVAGGSGTPILSTLRYAYSALPEQVYPFAVLRGPQFGYNICNSTTEGPNSNCQTLILNSPSDFCLWGSPEPNGSVGNDEAKVVAYCTKPGYGTRLIPPGSITGLQFIRTSAYIQITGFINNAALSLDPGDQGGELDPHGADLQGNPLGGVVYSNGTADSDGHSLTQVFNWNLFVGGNQFCVKACFNSITSPDYCENRYDLVGCTYNMPSSVQNGTFSSCQGDLQDPAGVYTTNGVVSTWSMPDPLTPPPYQPRTPASSQCTTYASTDLFGAVATTSGSSSTATNTSGSSGSSGSSGTKSSSSSSTSQTGKGNSAVSIKVPFTALGAVLGFVLLGGAML